MKKLKNELADAYKETVEVRELWNQTCEDILRETAVTLEKMQKEVEKAQKKQYEAERERDKALDKAREKNAEMYAAKAALEEEKEKNNALTARINKDQPKMKFLKNRMNPKRQGKKVPYNKEKRKWLRKSKKK